MTTTASLGVTFVDGGPVGLAFAADGGHLYVSDFGSSDVSTFVGADATAHGGSADVDSALIRPIIASG
jgi:DNA-binding beta-propeller fold protein YncE